MDKKGSILALDDEAGMLVMLERMFASEYRIDTFSTFAETSKFLTRESVDLILLDLKLKETDGIKVLKEYKKLYPQTEVIMLTAYGEVEPVVNAIRLGAFHFLAKPFEIEVLKSLVKNAIAKKRYAEEADNLKLQVQKEFGVERLIGSSREIIELKKSLRKIQEVDSTVFIIGESGTGKELIARIIHYGGVKRHFPFIAVNCGAISKEIMESELFGHIKGAFTGAEKDKIGFFEAAKDGTIFLDEITEMPLDLQVKLNRVLQEGEFYPVGSSTPRKSRARVITATNHGKAKLKDETVLRQDLYYRLNVLPVYVPPLRERSDDIPELAEFFLKNFSLKLKKHISGFTPEVMEKLCRYSWHGNIRHLENSIERAVIFEESGLITEQHFEGDISTIGDVDNFENGIPRYAEFMKEKQGEAATLYLQKLLKQTAGNVTKASKIAGIKRESLHRLLNRHSITSKRFYKP